MDQRKQFIQSFINKAQQKGYSPQETDQRLQGALQEYDQQSSQQGQPPSATQQGADLLRKMGLGILPNLAANITDEYNGASNMLQGKGKINITSGDYQNPFRTQQEASQALQSNPVISGLKDTAGAASWLVPETKVVQGGGMLARILNLAIQGGAMGGLSAASQPDSSVSSVAGGAATGAATNPALAGAGNVLTDILPRYIGWRNYGKAGLNLPEVTKAEQAASDQGMTLKQVRDQALQNNAYNPTAQSKAANIPNEFDPANIGFTTTSGMKGPVTAEGPLRQPTPVSNDQSATANRGTEDRSKAINIVQDLAKEDAYIGTPGLEDMTKGSGKKLPQRTGLLPEIEKRIQNAPDLATAYNMVKNLAYSTATQGNDKLDKFARAAAGVLREHLIATSNDPKATEAAMDAYANQTAMSASRAGGKGGLAGLAGDVAKHEGPDIGLGALAFLFPHLGLPLMGADLAVANRITGPATAKGLVNINQFAGKQLGSVTIGDIFRRLGIGGMQAATNQ